MRKLLPIILALIGTGAGVGAGIFLMPEPKPEEHAAEHCIPAEGEIQPELVKAEETGPAEGLEYVKMSNQFVVPVMSEERVTALVVAALSIEVPVGSAESVYAAEPKLRDVFLQRFFDHANIGGFDGSFTADDRMKILRRTLKEAAQSVLGSSARNVLITEIARQDAG